MTNRTFRHFTFLTLFTGLCALMFSLTGCGGGGASFTYGSPGPADGSSFSGTTVSINPTLQFLAGGVVNYQNAESSSHFPASASVVTGTYTYAPSSDYKTAVLTINLGAPLNTSVTLNITDFGTSNGNVKAFKVSYNGTTYTGNVTSGNMVAYVASSGGGSTGGSISIGGGTGAIGGSVVRNLVSTDSQPGSPYASGATLTFATSSSTLAFGGTTLTAPTVTSIDLSQQNYQFTDINAGLVYNVVYAGDTFSNQISVLTLGGTFVTAFVLP